MDTEADAGRPWLRYWGKARERDQAAPDHPLVFHSLDVAACGAVYLEHRPELQRMLADWLGIDAAQLAPLLTFLLAIHDIGKFAENFQAKAPDVVALRFGALPNALSKEHHDAISTCFAEVVLFEQLGRGQTLVAEESWQPLLDAVFGHHGVPARMPADARAALDGAMFEPARADALQYCAWSAAYFLPAGFKLPARSRAGIASWWVAGIAVLCDWIGSNTHWFPYADEVRRAWSLDDYYRDHALPRAHQALEDSGVLRAPIRSYVGPGTLFRQLDPGRLRPAQRLVDTLSIEAEPQLFVLEDATGSGKTEAALILAARLMALGLGDGFYVGLPTQATADQMFERVDLNVPLWFDDPRRASTVLAHDARDQSPIYWSRRGNELQPGSEPESASLRVTQWLADSNKRALLAQIGIGTLDQALVAALRMKHQSLRVLGLCRKILIVDEVHSYDPYMLTVLGGVLTQHAAAGGSAILLSATLALALRQKLLAAYARGAAMAKSFVQVDSEPLAERNEYPLLSRWSVRLGSAVEQVPFAAAETSVRSIAVRYCDDNAEVLVQIDAWIAAAQSVVWIRNTVTDAIAAYEALCRRHGSDRVLLFHSRFARVDRRAIQERVLAALGKKSGALTRGGRVIVTTQVFQESLDCDADQMVTDLAPIDVLLQRLGRLRRHRRDPHGDLLNPDDPSPDGRGPLQVWVHGPTRTDSPDAGWYTGFSCGAARVYTGHGLIWRSAEALPEVIRFPHAFRDLVEQVYGPTARPIPEPLHRAQHRMEGEAAGDQTLAGLNGIDLDFGYRPGDGWLGDERIGSRLSNSVEATLVRVDANRLIPWARGRCAADEDEWALSAIRLPGHWYDKNQWPEDERVQSLKQDHPALKHRVVVPLIQENESTTKQASCPNDPRLSYCDAMGLVRGKQTKEAS